MAKKRREAKGGEVAGFKGSPAGGPTSVAVAFFPFFSPGPAVAGSLSIGWEVFGSIIRVLGCRGKFRQVIFAGAKLLRLPRVGESLGIQLWVAEHFSKVGVVVEAVHGTVDVAGRGGWVMG